MLHDDTQFVRHTSKTFCELILRVVVKDGRTVTSIGS